MEFINNVGPIGKLMYNSNICAFRYLGYYFDENLIETNMSKHVFFMNNINDVIPESATCLILNMSISFERLHQIICNTNITSLIFYNKAYVENIDTNVVCTNITTVICYNYMSLNMINIFFPNASQIFLYRQIEGENAQVTPESYNFKQLRELYIYSSGTNVRIIAPHLENFSIYSTKTSWKIDVAQFPKLHTLRLDEKTIVENISYFKEYRILQFYPCKVSQASNDNILNLTNMKIMDLILPPSRMYIYEHDQQQHIQMNPTHIIGVYVNNLNFFKNILKIDDNHLQIFDNKYPLKMCNLRFTNSFYKYFPFPKEVTQTLIECFNIIKQKKNLVMIFNFDFMSINTSNEQWTNCYNQCMKIYHRVPIILQYGQLMLTNGFDNTKEIQWPVAVKKVRKECIIFIPEEELLYINCSPLRLQTLVSKIQTYTSQKFIIKKLWLVTNGFELKSKDIEERIQNLVVVHNEVKMYINF